MYMDDIQSITRGTAIEMLLGSLTLAFYTIFFVYFCIYLFGETGGGNMKKYYVVLRKKEIPTIRVDMVVEARYPKEAVEKAFEHTGEDNTWELEQIYEIRGEHHELI